MEEADDSLSLEPRAGRDGGSSGVARAALFAFVVSVAGGILPIYGAVQQLLAMRHAMAVNWLAPLIIGSSIVLAIIGPIFYLVVYLRSREIALGSTGRALALSAAFILTLVILTDAASLVRRMFAQTTVLDPSANHTTMFNVLSLLLQLTGLAPAPLLYLLSRNDSGEDAAPITPSRLLRSITNLAALICALVLAALLLRLAMAPYLHSLARDYAARTRQPIPTLTGMIVASLQTLLVQTCGLAAPLLVWFSFRRPSKPPQPGETEIPNPNVISSGEPPADPTFTETPSDQRESANPVPLPDENSSASSHNAPDRPV